MKPSILLVSGAEGLEADITSIVSSGGHVRLAVTALAVDAVFAIPPDMVRHQITRAPAIDAIKTGLLVDAATIEAMAGALDARRGTPFVLEPTMLDAGGRPLLAPDGVAAMQRALLPLASLITPTLPEAEALSGMVIRDRADLEQAAEMLLTLGVPAVLLRGSHLDDDIVTDVLATADGVRYFTAPRLARGTGCGLAGAVAVGLARGASLLDAVRQGHAHVVGQGEGG